MRYEANKGQPEKALILGARPQTRNIGNAIFERLADDLWNVIGDDCAIGDGTRPPGGNIPNDEVAEQHGYNVTENGRYQRFDVPTYDRFLADEADALIVSLGSTYKDHFANVAQHDLDRVLRANLLLPLEAARRFVQAREARMLEDSAHGIERDDTEVAHIIFIGSYAHRHPFTNGTAYCVAKAGIDMATRTLGWELTDRGYRIHVVHPFHVNGTPMWSQVEQDVMKSKNMTWDEADAYNRKDLKMPDLLTPEEVAEVVHTLLTVPAMGWTSGTSIELFGGSR